jgi:murein DD-endopeptidase MepM/ murein hydrolase activator NlpD
LALSLQGIITAVFGSGWTFIRGFDPSPTGHHGWDIANKIGTPIPNLISGTVVFAGFAGGGGDGYVHTYRAADNISAASEWWATGGGNTVEVQDANGVVYQYAHMSAFNVHVGDKVGIGSILGSVGDTGNATGPHLHFAVIDTVGGKKWIDPQSILAGLASTGGFNWLGAWDNAVSFPVGHILTQADVDTIIARLDAVHFFQATNGIPGLQQLTENNARDTTRSILLSHVGQAWNTTLEQQLQQQLFGAATAAISNPAQDLANLAGKVFDPNTYIHMGALIIGVVIAFYGLKIVISGSSAATPVST